VTIREARPEDAAGIARVHVESWRTTYPGIMPQEHLDALTYADREQTWGDTLRGSGPVPTTVYVAERDGGEIVGFAAGGRERAGDPDFQGEIYALYLLQACQGQRLGRRLVHTLARHMAEDGCRTLLIWVNALNPACRFYEALGGLPARTGQRTIKGVVYDDIGYGWDEDRFRRLVSDVACHGLYRTVQHENR
jgi:ribosomal protein S18 acetylase RimI-like enzyme